MAGITYAQADAQLQQWLNCLTAISTNQRYTIGEREFVRADLQAVQDAVDYWDGKVKALAATDPATGLGGLSGRRARIGHGW